MNGYHIVNSDNYGGDYPNEKFLKGWAQDTPHTNVNQLEWTTDPTQAQVWADHPQEIADRINKALGEYHDRYAKVVPVGYILKPGFEP